jgi:AmmeMemoRadiSam system protein B
MFENTPSSFGVRPPAVAGAFYPDDSRILKRQLTELLAQADASDDPVPKAIVVPHAGYVYSGPIAATAFKSVAPARTNIRRVVLLGPSHRVAFGGIACTRSSAYETPLGRVPVDHESVAELVRCGQVKVLDQAHAAEHSLEVNVPFLQMVLDEFSLIPLVVGDAEPAEVGAVIDALWGGPETLIVISSDLSHYHPYEEAKRRDRNTSNAIEDLQYELLDYESACGRAPLSGLLWEARRLGLEARTLDLRNSGDTAGDHRRVVGYGAYAIR